MAMKLQCKKSAAALTAALLAGLLFAGCFGRDAEEEPAETPSGSASPAETAEQTAEAERAGSEAGGVSEEIISLPPAMPAVGVGRIMPEVVEQRDILICVDPGHGFEDGGSGDAETSFYPEGTLEKDITLAVATLVNADLQKRGFQTVMTHNGVDEPEYDWDGNWKFNPNERVAMMNDLNPDYIVSIHTNTAGNPDACGVEVYYDHVSSAKANDWNEPAAETIAAAIDDLVKITDPTDLRNPINAENASLAVIRDSHPAACLIELGFCTNEQDAKNLTDPEWQASVADAIAEGIERFFDSMES